LRRHDDIVVNRREGYHRAAALASCARLLLRFVVRGPFLLVVSDNANVKETKTGVVLTRARRECRHDWPAAAARRRLLRECVRRAAADARRSCCETEWAVGALFENRHVRSAKKEMTKNKEEEKKRLAWRGC